MRHFLLYLLIIVNTSCESTTKVEDYSNLLLNVLERQTERYKRVYTEDFYSKILVERDSLILSSILMSSNFILDNRLDSKNDFFVDTIPGLKILDSLKIIDLENHLLSKEDLITLQFDALQNAYRNLSFNKFNIFNKSKVLIENSKSQYTHKEEDSIKIQLVFYDEYQWFPNEYSFNHKDTIESTYEIRDNYIKLDLNKKGINNLNGYIIFTNGIQYQIPYEYEYIVK